MFSYTLEDEGAREGLHRPWKQQPQAAPQPNLQQQQQKQGLGDLDAGSCDVDGSGKGRWFGQNPVLVELESKRRYRESVWDVKRVQLHSCISAIVHVMHADLQVLGLRQPASLDAPKQSAQSDVRLAFA